MCLRSCRIALIVFVTVVAATPLRAQVRELPAAPVADSVTHAADGWSTLRIAKWSLAGVAAGTAIYGFIHNQRADDRFEKLEQLCVQQPLRCASRLPSGAYADEEMEAEYQAVRDMDGRARTALIAGQVGVAASVLLFIIDLRNAQDPENIPYEPRALDVGRSRDGGLSLRVQLSVH